MITIILILVGLGAGFAILSGLGTKGTIAGGGLGKILGGGETGGGSGGSVPIAPGAPVSIPSGPTVGGNCVNFANATTKTKIYGRSNKALCTRMFFYCGGYDWSKYLPITMAALETDFSRSCYFYNLFNITTQSNNQLLYFMHKSITTLKFKMYTNFQESIADFWKLLQLPRYALAYQNRHNPEQAIIELIKGGYAGTDPLTGKPVTPDRYLNALNTVRGII